MLTTAKNTSPNGSIFLPTRCTVETRGFFGQDRFYSNRFQSSHQFTMSKNRVGSRISAALTKQSKLPPNQLQLCNYRGSREALMFFVSRQGRLDTQGGDSMPGMSQHMLDIPVLLNTATEKQFEAIRRDTFTITFSRCRDREATCFKKFSLPFHTVKALWQFSAQIPCLFALKRLPQKEVHSGKPLTTWHLEFLCL